MEQKHKRLPDSELEVMLIIWRSAQPIPTGDILHHLQKSRKTNLQAVQSTLNRLLDKGFVSCNKLGRLNYYTPLVAADDYRAREAATFVEKLYDNSPTKLFATLLRNNSISEADLRQLREILEKGGQPDADDTL